MITPELFLVDAKQVNRPDGKLTLSFENHSVELRWGDIRNEGMPKESYASGDQNRASPVNVLAWCLDHAIQERASTGFEEDWSPGAMVRPGVLTAYNSKGDWGTCAIDPNGDTPLSLSGTVAFSPIRNHRTPLAYNQFSGDGRFFVTGLVDPSIAKVVLVSPDGRTTGQPATIDHGSFAAVIDLEKKSPAGSKIRLYDRSGAVVYEGLVKPA